MHTEASASRELQQLRQLPAEIRQATRRPGGARITMERELLAIDQKLKNLSAALQATQAEAAGHAPHR